jgi:tRNA (cytosine38-C5)-methyltransferase
LNPTQIGIPNDRPRHYTIAVLPYTEVYLDNHGIVQWYNNQEFMDSTVQNDVLVRQSIPNFIHDMEQSTMLPLSNYLDQDNTSHDELIVPEKLIHSDSSWCFDIVTPEDCRSSCFTSSYGRFIRGTGSVIYTGSKYFEKLKLLPPEERTFDSNWSQGLNLVGNLRYFSGIEIGRLFGFPVDASVDGNSSFQFPPDCTEKQQWKLLGNSINVHVAAKMVYIGLSVMLAGVRG